jgi:hypothetical protein
MLENTKRLQERGRVIGVSSAKRHSTKSEQKQGSVGGCIEQPGLRVNGNIVTVLAPQFRPCSWDAQRSVSIPLESRRSGEQADHGARSPKKRDGTKGTVQRAFYGQNAKSWLAQKPFAGCFYNGLRLSCLVTRPCTLGQLIDNRHRRFPTNSQRWPATRIDIHSIPTHSGINVSPIRACSCS